MQLYLQKFEKFYIFQNCSLYKLRQIFLNICFEIFRYAIFMLSHLSLIVHAILMLSQLSLIVHEILMLSHLSLIVHAILMLSHLSLIVHEIDKCVQCTVYSVHAYNFMYNVHYTRRPARGRLLD